MALTYVDRAHWAIWATIAPTGVMTQAALSCADDAAARGAPADLVDGWRSRANHAAFTENDDAARAEAYQVVLECLAWPEEYRAAGSELAHDVGEGVGSVAGAVGKGVGMAIQTAVPWWVWVGGVVLVVAYLSRGRWTA